MHSYSLIALLIGIAATIWAVCSYRYWKAESLKFASSGYMGAKANLAGRILFAAACRLVTFLTVGKVKVIGKNNIPRFGRVILAANHQLPCDFAMLRRGSNRHFRMLTSAEELGGIMGVLGAYFGVISISFKNKGDGALAEAGCVRAVSEVDGALGIFPQGGLLPGNQLKKEEFRPGAVRIGKAAAAYAEADVCIVPIAIHYKRDPKQADWSHRFLKRFRRLFKGMANPKYWDPLFKVNTESLGEAEKAELLQKQQALLEAFRKSRVTNYGGVVVVGKPIKVSSLPSDPLEAIEIVRLAIVELSAQAQNH